MTEQAPHLLVAFGGVSPEHEVSVTHRYASDEHTIGLQIHHTPPLYQ